MKTKTCILITALLALLLCCGCGARETPSEPSETPSEMPPEQSILQEQSSQEILSVPTEESSEVIEESSTEESSASTESMPTINPDTGREPYIAVYEDKPRIITLELYDENTKELIGSHVITDRKSCNDLCYTFESSFADACNKFPAYNTVGDDRFYKADYRVLVRFDTYADEDKTIRELSAEVCYPYGNGECIYSIVHFDIFTEYNINNGKSFIDELNRYIEKHIIQGG